MFLCIYCVLVVCLARATHDAGCFSIGFYLLGQVNGQVRVSETPFRCGSTVTVQRQSGLCDPTPRRRPSTERSHRTSPSPKTRTLGGPQRKGCPCPSPQAPIFCAVRTQRLTPCGARRPGGGRRTSLVGAPLRSTGVGETWGRPPTLVQSAGALVMI